MPAIPNKYFLSIVFCFELIFVQILIIVIIFFVT